MPDTILELSESIGVSDRALRDSLVAGARYFYDQKGHIWIKGRFSAFLVSKLG